MQVEEPTPVHAQRARARARTRTLCALTAIFVALVVQPRATRAHHALVHPALRPTTLRSQ